MKMRLILMFFFVVGVFIVYVQLIIIVKMDKGEVLVGENGMMFYIFKNDKKGIFNCYEVCVQNWLFYFVLVGVKVEGVYFIVDCKDGGK